ncbi:LON peptidase substrate-binding domain-containing protein [Nocardioides sp. LMS-CY]|uniref:LON peptidase substrate-binding domain-containing protein n=1 Tax=Nocardioides sp. (strain LMS-CY) TaxID=2840457 RepID=UPI00207A5D55|nr:LON peptidase substrate-binding domain-containing protein [Nocardioides sp. LMS-CY]
MTDYVETVADTLPMFPLNAVLFPGLSVPLHVFEDRYRALVHELLRVADPAARLFGSVGIREGYEVGEHGAQSLYRVGCRLQLTDVESNADGSFDIVAVGMERIELQRLETGGTFPVGHVVDRPDSGADVPTEVLERARAAFVAYRAALADLRSDPYEGTLPRDPTYLSWTLAAIAPLPMSERQSLLEAEDATERLVLLTDLLRTELRAMNVIPSLPATEVARTRWSPN